MKKILTLFLSCAVSTMLFASEFKTPNKPSESEYKKLFKEYLSQDSENFNNHDFQKDIKLHDKYCHLGVADACDTLGNSYIFGLGAEQNAKKGIAYIEYAINNATNEIFKTQYKYSLELAKQIADKSQEVAIRHTIKTFSQKSSECQKRDGDKDSCFKAVIITGLLPHSMFGLGDYAGFFEMLYDNDVAINGTDNSKIAKMLKAYEDVLK